MTCRSTKRRDELRRVVPLKDVQWSEAWALVPPREYCQRQLRVCELIAVTGWRQQILRRKSLGKEFTLRSSKTQLLLAEVSLAKLATGSSSRKGSCGLSPKGRNHVGQPRGEVYSLLKGAQNVDSSTACCSVVLRLRTERNLVNGVTCRCVHS